MRRSTDEIEREKSIYKLCGCGCGVLTNWDNGKKRYGNFVTGHNIKVNNPNRNGKVSVRGDKHHMKRPEERARLSGANHWSKKSEHLETAFKLSREQSKKMSGAGNPGWQGGRPYRAARYRTLNGERMLAHRAAMIEHLGKNLAPWEIVHHIDHDRTNNSIENLFLFHCNFCHAIHHRRFLPLEYRYQDCINKYGSII